MSPVVDATSPSTRDEAVAAAVEAVRAGQAVVIPTDTVYGIGCDAFSPDAVSMVLEAKGRGREMPPPVLVGDLRVLDGLARDVLAQAFPGREIVQVPCRPLIWQNGSLHCITMQLPAGLVG